MKRIQLIGIITLMMISLQVIWFQLKAQPSHDPTELVKEGDRYWSFNTGNGIWVMSATNAGFSNWREEDPVFPVGTWPAWINTYVDGFGGNFWAPAIAYMNGKWHIYYSCSSFGSQNSAIGLATTDSLGSGNWEDQGMVTYSDDTWPVNAIDADIFKDNDGKVWMLYGSWWDGIVMTELDSLTGKPLEATNITHVANNRCEAGHLAEHDGLYYLFFNRGSCCSGINSTYQIFMGRSANPTGPFYDKDSIDCNLGGGTSFLHSDGNYLGPGHFGLLDTLLSYHYYHGAAGGASYLKVSKLRWVDGWPVAEYEPTGKIEQGPYVMKNRHSNKIIEVEGAGTDEGANVALASEAGLDHQQWTFEYLDNHYYRISPVHDPEKALEVAGGSVSNGANVQVSSYTGAPGQQWYIGRMGAYSRIMNRNSYQALEIVNAYTYDGANAQQWPFNEHFTQQWYIKAPLVIEDAGILHDDQGIRVYPNPSNGSFSIDPGEKYAGGQLAIYTAKGQLVCQDLLKVNEIYQFPGVLDTGLYLLRVINRDGAYTTRLLVE
ncbi:MAG: family 43 glycosylhydrolase [Bacteroidales bacterium]|nr:family 43 glycosylhydrolase [Bacteroidales bacterium]